MADEKDKKPRDLRQEVTDKMIEVLDKGEIPWNKPWESFENGLPRNMATGREYNGANSLMLMMAGYHDPRFGTFRQVNELGGKVTRGEKGIPIEFWGKEPFYQRRDTTVKYLDRAYKVFSEDRDVVHIGGFRDSASTLAIRSSELKVHHQGKVLTWDEAHKSSSLKNSFLSLELQNRFFRVSPDRHELTCRTDQAVAQFSIFEFPP